MEEERGMKHSMERERKKAAPKHMGISVLFFLAVMVLTFFAFFRNTQLSDIYAALARMSPWYLAAAAVCAAFFVSAEGMMIWYLLASIHKECRLPHKRTGIFRCIAYSFIGFFYSGITPSATGGQPMQLYYMKKDGNRLSDSSVVLMTVAVIYKLVLALTGIGIFAFWYHSLKQYLGNYLALYIFGVVINAVVVALLLFVMLIPDTASKLIHGIASGLEKIHILKPSAERAGKIDGFVDGYRASVKFLVQHKGKVLLVIIGTFLQRFSMFFLTWLVYRGFHLEGTGAFSVLWLQAAVYIAVDMLPIPGAQGITELMYKSVFATVFPVNLLMPSMLAVRGLNFYLLLVISLVVVLWNLALGKKSVTGKSRG